ncbi:hypothetical protein Q8A73_020633 [Channa argus]|nr:hypothetical protein Q8A73_020633 [Channa argus]
MPHRTESSLSQHPSPLRLVSTTTATALLRSVPPAACAAPCATKKSQSHGEMLRCRAVRACPAPPYINKSPHSLMGARGWWWGSAGSRSIGDAAQPVDPFVRSAKSGFPLRQEAVCGPSSALLMAPVG